MIVCESFSFCIWRFKYVDTFSLITKYLNRHRILINILLTQLVYEILQRLRLKHSFIEYFASLLNNITKNEGK